MKIDNLIFFSSNKSSNISYWHLWLCGISLSLGAFSNKITKTLDTLAWYEVVLM